MDREGSRTRQQICHHVLRDLQQNTHINTPLSHTHHYQCSPHSNVPGEGNWAFTVGVHRLKGGIVCKQRDELIYPLNRMIRKWREKWKKEERKKMNVCEGLYAPVAFGTNVKTHLLGQTLQMFYANLQWITILSHLLVWDWTFRDFTTCLYTNTLKVSNMSSYCNV